MSAAGCVSKQTRRLAGDSPTELGEAEHGEKSGGRTSSLRSSSILANTKMNVSGKQTALH